MAITYKKIASVTVGAGGITSGTLLFDNIPATYTDIEVSYSVRTNRASPNTVDGLYVRFNGSASTYTTKLLYGNGSSALSNNDNNAAAGNGTALGATASTFSNGRFYVPNYAGSTAKSYTADAVQENNATTGHQFMTAALWSGTSAITSITIYTESGSAINEFSTFFLYGILKA